MKTTISNLKRQTGVALVISLILLVLVSILGLAGIRSTGMQQKMAANYRDAELSFQATESALRGAETTMLAQGNELLPSNDGTTGVWALDSMDPNTGNALSWWHERDSDWWDNNATAQNIALENINSDPQTIIEYQHFIADDLLLGDGSRPTGLVYYRITARGTGGSDNANTQLQSTFARRY